MAAGRENFIFFHCPLDGERFSMEAPGLLFVKCRKNNVDREKVDYYNKSGLASCIERTPDRDNTI